VFFRINSRLNGFAAPVTAITRDYGDYGDLASPSPPSPFIKVHQHSSRPIKESSSLINAQHQGPSRSINIHQDQSALVRVHL
jgi:hypothetical protein